MLRDWVEDIVHEDQTDGLRGKVPGANEPLFTFCHLISSFAFSYYVAAMPYALHAGSHPSSPAYAYT